MIGWRWLVLFLIVSSSAFGQRLTDGKIIDQDSGKPVPFASIIILGSSRGTSSNINGEFSLPLPDQFTLRVTCIGYATKEVTSIDAVAEIKLKPTATTLDAVLVSNKPIKPKSIVQKALAKVSQNYNPHPFLQKFFYRHYCRDNGSYGRLIEASVDVWKNKGYKSFQRNAGANEEIRITQLRRSLDRTKMSQGHEPIMVKNILETDLVGYQVAEPTNRIAFYSNVSNLKADLDKYVFEFDGLSFYDGQEVYKISYARKDTVYSGNGDYRVRSQVEGSLFIATDNHAVIKREEVRTYGVDTIRTTTFYAKHDDRYYPYHLILDGGSYSPELGSHVFHIEMISVEISTDESDKFVGHLPTREELLNVPYDSVFWTSNTILKTTPLEDDIIRDLGGGTSLNKQFYRYRQYELNVTDGGVEGEKKLTWLKEDSKGNRILYLMFWSPDFQSYIGELERIKQLHKQYRDNITFVYVSLDDDDVRWQQTVKRFNLTSDGIINYRIGSNSPLFTGNSVPSFVLIGRNGETVDIRAKRPTDPTLADDFASLITQNN